GSEAHPTAAAAAKLAAAALGTQFDVPFSCTGGRFPRAPHLRDEDNLRLFSKQSLAPPYFRGNSCIMPHEDAPHHGQAARQQRLGRPIHQVTPPHTPKQQQ
ncbi:unnamed protein product, partial [Ectocarpus sp. 8 AP-2014]